MEAYLIDWLNLLVRWLHFITGVAWIGSSFYFVWLDNHLETPVREADRERGVGGEVWSVHGGGFYRAEKYRDKPPSLPDTLHWFKWEAYSTWLSGMFLLALVYWYGANVYLVDARVADLSAPVAIAASIGLIAGGWLVYDGLCRSRLGGKDTALGITLLGLVTLLAWGLTELFSGRAAYIHFGAVLGTIMVGNVFFVIIPGQRRMVEAVSRGEVPDPRYAIAGKRRSVHNTYFTLPVLFAMTSNHFALLYGHALNWLILVAITIAGALIRVYFVARHRGRAARWPLAVAVGLLAAVAAAIAPRTPAVTQTAAVTFDDVRGVIISRCTSCHAAEPSQPGFVAAPAGVHLETDAQIRAEAERIHQQTVVSRVMPIGNLTGITEDERAIIDRWYRTRSPGHD